MCAGQYLSGCQNLESNDSPSQLCNEQATAANFCNNVNADWSGILAGNRDAWLCVQ
jgi:hypothetical protein